MKSKSKPAAPLKQAVALSYAGEKASAPVVKAKGKGATAERIVDIAKQHGVPVHEDAALVEMLAKLDLDQEIPPELYQLVAEVLSFVYRTDRDLGELAARKENGA